MEHLHTKLRICRLNGNINRRQMIPNDSRKIMLLHICQCNIISLKKRQSRIVILKIKRISHSRRHLIDEAENALVGAGTVIGHQAALEFDTKIFIEILVKFPFHLCTILFLDNHINFFILNIKTIIKDIFNILAIDLQDLITRL